MFKKKKNYVVNVMMPGRVAHEHVAVVAVIGHHRLDRIQPSVPFYTRKYKKIKLFCLKMVPKFGVIYKVNNFQSKSYCKLSRCVCLYNCLLVTVIFLNKKPNI